MNPWSIDSARAFLLISVAAVDGSFADAELESIRPSLVRAGLSDDRAIAAMGEALRRYRDSIQGDRLEGALLSSAQHLKQELPRPELTAFMDRLLDTAFADAEVRRNEHAYLRMLKEIWEI
jgi:uncharacterized tellurite resistance protein B-like protein